MVGPGSVGSVNTAETTTLAPAASSVGSRSRPLTWAPRRPLRRTSDGRGHRSAGDGAAERGAGAREPEVRPVEHGFHGAGARRP
jgi:hypothetical protein